MINSKDISVIVQGGINQKETPKCLESLRKYLPNAEIILSTWEGSDVSKLDYDILILNKDPGAVRVTTITDKVIYNNMNRQLLSTKEGLKKASRKYSFKLRSDLILTSDKFLEYFDKFQTRCTEYKLFKRKIVTSAIYSRYKKNKYHMPFHVSDWWYLGLTEDLQLYFNKTELVDEPDFTYYFENRNQPSPFGKVKHKFSPEQYFAYECFSRNFDDIKMQDAADYDEELLKKSEICFANNFIILEFAQSGIYTNKYKLSKNELMLGDHYLDLYNFYRYEKSYQKYCDNDYKITAKGFFEDDEKLRMAFAKLYKHFYKITENSTTRFEKIEHIFIGLPFAVLNLLLVSLTGFIRNKK